VSRAAVRLAVAALAVSTVVSAQEPPRGRVTVTVTGAGPRVAFLASARELLGRLGVALDEAGGEGPLVGAATVELGTEECTISLSDQTGKLSFFRRVPALGSPALLVEAAAHVLQSAVEELLFSGLRKPRVVKAPAPPPVVEQPGPAPAPPPQPAPGLDLAAFAGGAYLGTGAPLAVGAGLAVSGVVRHVTLRPALTLSAGYRPPVDIAGSAVTIALQMVTLRAVASVIVLSVARFQLELGAGGGGDLSIVVGRLPGLPSPRQPRTVVDVAPMATGQVTARLGVNRAAEFYVSFALDLDFNPPAFATEINGRRETIFSPWRVRPAVAIGFSFGVAGASP
jgi:hypothetical protein